MNFQFHRAPRFRLALLIAAAWIGAHAALAGAQTVSIGSVSGKPGWIVTVNVSLNPQGDSVTATQNDITFNSVNTPIITKTDGKPDCTVNAAIGKSGSFVFHPTGCYGADCNRVRALINNLSDNSTLIPNGVLYLCRIQIATAAVPGTYPLTNSGVVASDAPGNDLGAIGTNGQVTVTSP